MAKGKTPEERLKRYSAELVKSIEQYKSIIEYGCSDPSRPDGCNANLCRNHVLAYKRYILDICTANDLKIPQEYYLPTPPEQDNRFMADKTSERYKRLNSCLDYHGRLTTRKVDYDDSQMSL